jgi:hypothetical protein
MRAFVYPGHAIDVLTDGHMPSYRAGLIYKPNATVVAPYNPERSRISPSSPKYRVKAKFTRISVIVDDHA